MNYRGRSASFHASPLLVSALAATTIACGARNELELADAGGTGGTSTGNPSSTANAGGSPTSSSVGVGAGGEGAIGSGGGAPDICAGLVVAEPGPAIVGGVNGASDPQLAFFPDGERVLLTFVGPASAGPALHVRELDASAPWPPAVGGASPLIPTSSGYALGTSPTGPVALVGFGGNTSLAVVLGEGASAIDDAPTPPGKPLFTAAIDDRFLYATSQSLAAFEQLQVGSYQPGSLPQTDDPLICLGTEILAAGVASGAGFLAAFAAPGEFLSDCDPNGAMGSTIDLYRYESPSGLGSSLEPAYGGTFDFEPADVLLGVHLAPASFGAWLVWQQAGINAEVPPPPFAIRLDPTGAALDPVGSATALGTIGWGGPVAVASLGDDLIVAWAEYADPSAPLVMVQMVRADGSLGPSTSFYTHELWQTGPMRIAAQPNGKQIFVTWEGGMNQTDIAMARIDCVGP